MLEYEISADKNSEYMVLYINHRRIKRKCVTIRSGECKTMTRYT